MTKALADPTRVRILAALRGRELCVCELCDALEATQSTLSSHLQLIREAGLAVTRREGKWSYYAVDPGAAAWLEAQFAAFAASLAEDRTLAADARRLEARLALRSEGACSIGFSAAKPRARGAARGEGALAR